MIPITVNEDGSEGIIKKTGGRPDVKNTLRIWALLSVIQLL